MQKEISDNQQALLNKARRRLNHSVEESQMLQSVEETLNSVGRIISGNSPALYNEKAVFSAAENLSRIIDEGDTESLEDGENQLAFEIEKWREDIVSRDSRLETYNLRRYFEKIHEPVSESVFESLARFYRSLPHDEPIQSKFDFAITNLYAKKSAAGTRQLCADGEHLTNDLKRMFACWNASGNCESGDESEIFHLVRKINAFVEETNDVATLEDIVARDLFNRIRTLKRAIGELFYLPEVTAAFTECNIIIGNKFTELVNKNREQTAPSPEARLDFGELFRHSSSDIVSQIEDALNDLPADEKDNEYVERMSRLVRLLQFADEGAELPPLEVQSENFANNKTVETSQVIIRQLAQISEQAANAEAFSELRGSAWSAEIQALDLAMFLKVLPAEETDTLETRSRALMLTLQADKLITGELSGSGAIDLKTERSLTDLLAEMQKLSSELQRLMKPKTADEAASNAEALLYVSNHLLKSRLNLQTAVLRRGADEIARQEEASRLKTLVEREVLSMPQGAKTPVKPARRAISRWLVAVAAALLIGVIGLRFALTSGGAAEVKRDASVVVLNCGDMPEGAMLENARVSKDTLIGIVSDKWDALNDEEKRERLQVWVQYAEKYGATSVLLMNKSGEPKGDGSPEKITTDADFKS